MAIWRRVPEKRSIFQIFRFELNMFIQTSIAYFLCKINLIAHTGQL